VTGGRAAVITAPRTFEIRHVEARHPEPGQVAVLVGGCGVCGSNAPVWEGRPWFDYPLSAGQPGHEAWGAVDAVGEDVSGLDIGNPVALLTPVGFQDRVVATPEDLVALPESLRGMVFPGEALGCGFNVARRSAFQHGQTVAVVGIGFLGAIVTALAVQAGAHVIAISRRTSSLDLARSLGAAETVVMDEHDRIIGAVTEITGGDLCDTVVEAVGMQWPLDLAGQLTAVSGRLVVAGYHQDGLRSVDMQRWNWRGLDIVNAHERDPATVRRGVEEAAAAVVEGRFDPSSLYTDRYPLDQLGAAFDALVERPAGFVKAVVVN
jgi:threonine dehydrogenase-like Zn-dependent dehydrogenase